MPECSILVVEDEARLRATVVEFLREEGYPASGAASGREALAKLDQQPPEIVVLDMHLPDTDGWQVARLMRERGLDSKIVVMTAAGDARRVANELQADGYVAKPFALIQLLDALDRLCGGTA
jgi:two-component system catabolic regulation response regulator CreB